MNTAITKLLRRAAAAIITAALCLASVCALFGCGTSPAPVTVDEPPDTVPQIYSVVITHGDVPVEGMLQADMAAGTVKLGASVDKDGAAAGRLSFSSSDTDVAQVDRTGNVTLVGPGETIITATYGGKSCTIVLVVTDDTTSVGTVTVNGGRANVSSARVGDVVTLTPVPPEHKVFVRWQFSANVTWINGSTFRMPASNVTVTAEYVDKLYTLRVIGGSVTADGGAAVSPGESKGYDGAAAPENAITEYTYKYCKQ